MNEIKNMNEIENDVVRVNEVFLKIYMAYSNGISKQQLNQAIDDLLKDCNKDSYGYTKLSLAKELL